VYDKRNAKKLSRSRKPTPNHRQSEADFAVLKECAKYIAQKFSKAKLISFHKRRKRLFWDIGNNTYLELKLIGDKWYNYSMGEII
jgi:hypothetical protein